MAILDFTADETRPETRRASLPTPSCPPTPWYTSNTPRDHVRRLLTNRPSVAAGGGKNSSRLRFDSTLALSSHDSVVRVKAVRPPVESLRGASGKTFSRRTRRKSDTYLRGRPSSSTACPIETRIEYSSDVFARTPSEIRTVYVFRAPYRAFRQT